MPERKRVGVTDERQSVRLLALVVALLALVTGVGALAFGGYLLAGGCLVVVIACGVLAGAMYRQVHAEQLAQIARGTAVRAVGDPFDGTS